MQGRTTNTLATGLAIFSMFFGAGNVIFPLGVGQTAKNLAGWASVGLLISAVLVPFLGLLSMTLFDGIYRQFFGRLGVVPGYLLEVFILLLIGPFGALPRCIILAEANLEVYFPQISLAIFSFLSCLVIFLCTWKRTMLLDILGYILTPLLLLSLFPVVAVGLWTSPPPPEASATPIQMLLLGLREGYFTMDLFGAFFFSSVVLLCLKREMGLAESSHYSVLSRLTLRAGWIGMALLALVYAGFTLIASRTTAVTEGAPQEQLLGIIALEVLGSHLGILSSIAVALACLTTAIALTAAFAEFVHEDLSKERINWTASLAITLGITFLVSTWRFEGITRFLTPLLTITYPCMITLALCNIAYKLQGFRPVKGPVLAVFILSLLAYFF